MGIFLSSDARNSIKELKNQLDQVNHEIVEQTASVSRLTDSVNSVDAPKFEYLIREDIGEPELDERGLKGWELVSCTSYTVGFGVSGNASMKVHMKYIFKRPVGKMTSGLQGEIDRLGNLKQRHDDLAKEIQILGGVL